MINNLPRMYNGARRGMAFAVATAHHKVTRGKNWRSIM